MFLDCTKLVPNILPDKRDFLMKTESHARLLCYKLHLKDCTKLVPNILTDTDTDKEYLFNTVYVKHDTT